MERPPLSTYSFKLVARGLAEALVAGPWRLDDLVDRGGRAVGRRGRWLRPLVRRLLEAIGAGPRPSALRVAAWLLGDAAVPARLRHAEVALSGQSWPPRGHGPGPGRAAGWAVPEITTAVALAGRFGLTPGNWTGSPTPGHVVGRPTGRSATTDIAGWRSASGSARLIEAPKPRLQAIQRRLLDEVLAPIPPHDAAHGYCPGRSARTFAGPHVGRDVVLRMDLRDFFPSITAGRVRALFRTAGYPDEVANLLTGLCTNVAPSSLWRGGAAPAGGAESWRSRRLYAAAPPAAGGTDLAGPGQPGRLPARLPARRAGRLADASYTRYADDLLFSGGPDFARGVERFSAHVGAIAIEEGYEVAHHKTRVMRRGVRQRTAGLVLNERINVARDEYDALRATLFNCTRGDPRQQDRVGRPDFRAHLAGRVAHVASVHPERGRRLKALFDRIDWPSEASPSGPGAASLNGIEHRVIDSSCGARRVGDDPEAGEVVPLEHHRVQVEDGVAEREEERPAIPADPGRIDRREQPHQQEDQVAPFPVSRPLQEARQVGTASEDAVAGIAASDQAVDHVAVRGDPLEKRTPRESVQSPGRRDGPRAIVGSGEEARQEAEAEPEEEPGEVGGVSTFG